MNVPIATGSERAARAGAARHAAAISAQDAIRERILEASQRAFAERGYHGTSVPEIAKAAQVGVGSIYRHFESKERLVNAVFRDSKGRLRDALLLDFDLGRPLPAMFADLWSRLVRFQRAHPLAFQFLEMQDHVPYLDRESRAVEASLLAPILVAAQGATEGSGSDESPALVIAMVWGAFVSLTKAERLGYLPLDDDTLRRAGEIAFAAVAFALRIPVTTEPKTKRNRKGG